MTTIPLLDIRDLTVEFATRRGTVRAVQHIDITVAKGETLAIVGESGSGKSVTSYAVMRILDRAGAQLRHREIETEIGDRVGVVALVGMG